MNRGMFRQRISRLILGAMIENRSSEATQIRRREQSTRLGSHARDAKPDTAEELEPELSEMQHGDPIVWKSVPTS
jgi:hypothetical protein